MASSLLTTVDAPTPPVEFHQQTRIVLGQSNFKILKTNVVGRSTGFSLLGFITIQPATLTEAVNNMYAGAQVRPGQADTMANVVVEQSSSYYLLFGIPEVDVRGDLVEFGPAHRR